MRPFLIFFTFLVFLTMPNFSSHAASMLPEAVQKTISVPMSVVGQGTYRKYGFRIYNATLWAPKGQWYSDQPYALEIHYTRSLSKDTVVDSVVDDIRDQNVTDDATLAVWTKTLNEFLPEIADGDVLIGTHVPGKKSDLFYNGKKIASLSDPDFSEAFFAVWLGPTADEDLKDALLTQKK